MKTNYVRCGNCAELMAALPPNSIDLTVTSPPYDNLRDYNGFVFPFEEIAAELFRVTKPGGIVVWIVGDATVNGSETGTSFRQALHFMDLGFLLHDTMIYEKEMPTFAHKNRYYPVFEFMFILSKGEPPKTTNLIKDRKNKSRVYSSNKRQINGTFKRQSGAGKKVPPYGGRYNIWRFGTGGKKTAKDNLWKEHPAVMPLQLAKDHIVSWSNPGETILDPMCGSGQTLVAAMMTDRKFIGFDISQEYIDLTKKRLTLYAGKKKILDEREAAFQRNLNQ